MHGGRRRFVMMYGGRFLAAGVLLLWSSLVVSVTAVAEAGAFSIPIATDSGGRVLDGSAGRYTLTFAAGALPPVRGRWSLDMYALPDQLLVANPIGRYSIDSSMLQELKRDADGGLTLFIQKVEPRDGKEANWLPAPAGPFLMILRLHGPEPAVRDNAWEAPPVERVGN